MRFLYRRFKRNARGATAVEYAMLLGLFAAGILVWGTRAGEDVDKRMETLAESIDEMPGGKNAPKFTKGGD